MKPSTTAAPSGRVFYLGADRGFVSDLTPLLATKNVQIDHCADAAGLLNAAEQATPDVVVLEVESMAARPSLADLVAQLDAGPSGHTRIICIASREHGGDSVEARVAALRAGAASYLVKPVSRRRLASRVLRMCGIVEPTRYRILIMDHDQDQAKRIATLLATIGMETLVVDDPMKVLARMHAFRPNLVLMDLDLSGVTGPELTAVIRDHDDFYGIPILFLSEEQDLDAQLAALKAGGDGFINKPVTRDALIAAVEYRMRMSRWLQDRRTLVNRRETASGFLPRDVFMRHLEQITRAANPQGPATGLIVIELDEHQLILSKLGLTSTEKLLRELEGLLSKLVGADESATRLDDFRYALLAKRDTTMALESLAGTLCQQLAGLRPRDRDVTLNVTASIGIGLLDSPAEDAVTIVSRAEKAVMGARAAGGNQVHVWSTSQKAGGGAEAESVIKRLVSTALAQDGFILMFQPILPLSHSQDELYEAQIRMQTLDGERIPPGDFLSVAERAEMMPRVDRWVLRRAFEVMNTERSAHPRLRLLVHQNIPTLAVAEWFPWFRDQILKRNLTQIYPLLQFQMADVRQHRSEAKMLVERLRQYGIQVCVANVSGLREEVSLLGRIGVTLAKLAFPTVRKMEQARLREVVQALQSRGVAVIAPGIDDQETVSRVWMCQPDFIQGNYLQEPGTELSFDFQRMSHDA